jgi:hypothetical protein
MEDSVDVMILRLSWPQAQADVPYMIEVLPIGLSACLPLSKKLINF